MPRRKGKTTAPQALKYAPKPIVYTRIKATTARPQRARCDWPSVMAPNRQKGSRSNVASESTALEW